MRNGFSTVRVYQTQTATSRYASTEKLFTFYDVNHLPFDLTDYTPTAQIKKSHGSAKVASFVCNVLEPAANGQMLLSLQYNTLANTSPGIYSYDILLSSANTKIRAVEGTVNIIGNITTWFINKTILSYI